MRSHLTSGLIGAALGAGGVWVGLSASPSTSNAPSDPVQHTQPASSAPTVVLAPGTQTACPEAVVTELEQLRTEVETLRFKTTLQEGELAQSGAREIAWPEDTPAALTRESFESEVDKMVAALGGAEVEALACDEYPCIAFVRAESEAAVDRYFESGQAFLEEGSGLDTGVRTIQSSDGTWWAAFHTLADGVVPVDAVAVNQRVEVRVFDHIGSR